MSKVLPILFNTDMVKAILDGRKTATRRFIWIRPHVFADKMYREGLINSQPCEAGDLLYVRETFCYLPEEKTYEYKADGKSENRKWRPSIHMPKEAARIWLKVTGVRIEHIQEMTLDDFLAEGVHLRPEAFNGTENALMQARTEFMGIWDSVRPKCSFSDWESNPWVWVIEFERCERPEGC